MMRSFRVPLPRQTISERRLWRYQFAGAASAPAADLTFDLANELFTFRKAYAELHKAVVIPLPLPPGR